MALKEPRLAWGETTEPLTPEEIKRLHAVGCQIFVEQVSECFDPKPGETQSIWRSSDGGCLAIDGMSACHGYLRWLLKHEITPSRISAGHQSCAVGYMPDGTWMGWSHLAARVCPDRESAVAFAISVD